MSKGSTPFFFGRVHGYIDLEGNKFFKISTPPKPSACSFIIQTETITLISIGLVSTDCLGVSGSSKLIKKLAENLLFLKKFSKSLLDVQIMI